MNDPVIKEKLLEKCYEYVSKRMAAITQTIDQAQKSAASETKSSAGDKYETGRSMMQLEQERNAKHLEETMKLKKVLDQINLKDSPSHHVQLGSLVLTEEGNFFLSISMGKVEIDSEEYIVLSPVSPIGKTLTGKKVQDDFEFNKRLCKILQIF